MKTKKIVISGINMVEGGIFTILNNVLHEISIFIENKDIQVIAFVHDASKFQFKNIQIIELPKSKKSWFYRLFYEYFYFKKISKKINVDIWLSLHDTTPNVVAKKRFVYCHHPTTLFKPTWKDWKFNYKIGLFSLLYDYLFNKNIAKNHTVFVQQHWIKSIFEKRFKISNIKVALPQFVEEITTEEYIFTENKVHFLYPSFPRSFKNHEIIFEAIKLLPKEINEKCEFHFTTLKNNEEKYAKFLIEKYTTLNNVVLYDKVKRKQLLTMYNSMNCLLFPSKVETWGLPISEAKAYKKPMFLANLPYAKETCGDYEKVTFFDENNPNELANLIVAFVSNKHTFQGNKYVYKNEDVLYNWRELFQYLITE